MVAADAAAARGGGATRVQRPASKHRLVRRVIRSAPARRDDNCAPDSARRAAWMLLALGVASSAQTYCRPSRRSAYMASSDAGSVAGAAEAGLTDLPISSWRDALKRTV